MVECRRSSPQAACQRWNAHEAGGRTLPLPQGDRVRKSAARGRQAGQAFLKDRRFLLASPNAYNSLGVGTTQLYDKTVVYNHKRHGKFSLGGRTFEFRIIPFFPKKLSKEFLLVDLVNNLDRLAESRNEVLARVKERAASYDVPRLQRAARDYGKVRTRKFFTQAMPADKAPHAG